MFFYIYTRYYSCVTNGISIAWTRCNIILIFSGFLATRLAIKTSIVLYPSSLKRTLPSRNGRLVSWINMLLIMYLCLPETSLPYVIIAASVPCSHGHTSDATAGVKQRPTTATAGKYRLDRPLQRQPYAISRTIADQLQPAHGAVGTAAVGTLEQS